MRTLIIDNYDSFTHNLAHYLAEATGAEPVVVRNDAVDLGAIEQGRFDNIIISPGPGRPRRAADFGRCAEVIRGSTVPVLGVCLGHQGICEAFGLDIQPAPEPFHGRRSPVLHTGADILAGLPSPFSAVRYHSLVAAGTAEEIEPIGWTPDGLLMAVRHRTRPLWGVQFHPESICTEHGHRLLRNFTELTRHRRNKARSAARDQGPPALITARPAGRKRRMLHRRLPVDVPADAAFDRLYADSDFSFWLDSSAARSPQGRFSFMGDASGPLSRVVQADVWTGRLTVESATGRKTWHGSFLDWMRAELETHRIEPADLPFDFTPGWIGYLGYELKAECGAAPVHRSPHPDAMMIFADRALAFDHAEGAVHLLALCDGDDDAAALTWLAETAAILAVLAAEGGATAPDAGPDAGTEPETGELLARHDRARYLELIAACQREIRAGESYEVCLTNMLTASGKFDPPRAYRRLRRQSPVPFGAQLRFGSLWILSGSPERFLRVSRDGMLESSPIKGTRPRSPVPRDDAALRADLAGSVKDRAENLMIVDLVRNDLGSCAEIGSVQVDRLFDVETYATVHQLVSTVRARLRRGLSAVDCVRAAFPGGSMTGAPKLRTLEIIDALEGGPRGVYSGALGYFALSGAADFSVVIRTLVASPGRIEYGVGGAITALSDAAEEFTETVVKAAPLLRLLGRPYPGSPARPRTAQVR